MPDQGFSYRFSNAIVRQPGRSVARGLRALDRGAPDFERFQAEHREYVGALERAGLKVRVLDALEAFPDSVFIEDASLCLPEGIVMLRPGAPSRTGEASLLAETLAGLGYEIIPCESDGFIDGGDILLIDSAILVGLSERTDLRGFEWLKAILQGRGYPVQAVHTPEGILHFKSDCCVLDSQTILATHRLSRTECFASFRVLTVPLGEEAAANCIRINDTVLVPAGYPATAELLAREGYAVETVAVTQPSLLDGGLSCMSLRYHSLAMVSHKGTLSSATR
jgi:dimethylargininase